MEASCAQESTYNTVALTPTKAPVGADAVAVRLSYRPASASVADRSAAPEADALDPPATALATSLSPSHAPQHRQNMGDITRVSAVANADPLLLASVPTEPYIPVHAAAGIITTEVIAPMTSSQDTDTDGRDSSIPSAISAESKVPMAVHSVPTLVLDLDETLVHASAVSTPKDDFSFS